MPFQNSGATRAFQPVVQSCRKRTFSTRALALEGDLFSDSLGEHNVLPTGPRPLRASAQRRHSRQTRRIRADREPSMRRCAEAHPQALRQPNPGNPFPRQGLRLLHGLWVGADRIGSGQNNRQARELGRDQLVNAVGGLPPASEHASHLAMDALAAAFNQLAGRT